MTKFFILGTQRSGTSLLKTYLASHAEIKSFGELFHYSDDLAIKNRYQSGTAVPLFLENLYKGYPEARAVGFKLMYDQSEKYAEILPWLRANSASCIYIERQNIVKLYLSKHIAKLTNRWVMREEQTMQSEKIHLETADIVQHLDAIAQEQVKLRQIRDTFSDNITLYYEEMVADVEAMAAATLSFLNIPYSPLSTPLKKINAESIEAIIDNYDALQLRLRGTRYEPMLSADL